MSGLAGDNMCGVEAGPNVLPNRVVWPCAAGSYGSSEEGEKGAFSMKLITLIKLTDEGRKHLPEGKDVFVKVTEIVDSFGGKIDGVWATTGRYDFITVVEYPTAEAGLKGHAKVLETGFFLMETSNAYDMDAFLAAV